MKLLAITSQYPSSSNPQRGTFVHTLMRDLSRIGNDVTVAAPDKIFSLRNWRRGIRVSATDEVFEGVKVVRPSYLPFSNRHLFGRLSTYRLTVSNFRRAATRATQSLSSLPDLCYGHFLYPAGFAATSVATSMGAKSVVALGESSFNHYEEHLGLERVRRDLGSFDHVLAVSEENKRLCISRYDVPAHRVTVFPNAAAAHFRPTSKSEARNTLGLQADRPIIIFVGQFTEAKGPQRVLNAIKSRPDIGAVFLGEGPVELSGEQILFKGAVPHDRVPLWMSAADVQVHPTEREGSSNCLKEALACGLPIVASNIESNLEFLDSSVATLVEPLDIGQIKIAIEDLVDDQDRRNSMSRAALERAEQYKSIDRANRILRKFEELVLE